MTHQLIRFYRQIPTPFIVATPTAAAAYAGPGDVVAGATAWWGLRAYSNATIGTSAVRLREDGGNTEQDFATIAGGGLDLAAIATFKGGNNLFVVKMYDQTGNGFDLVQATAGSQPAFMLSAIGSLPAIDTTGVNSIMTLSSWSNLFQPVTISHVFIYTTDSDGFLASGSSEIRSIRVNETVGKIGVFAGSSLNGFSAAKNVWHAVQAIFNGASSDVNINGVANVGDAGTNALNNSFSFLNQFGTFYFIGMTTEMGIWNSAFNGGNSSAMSANQHTYWGF